VPRDDTDRPGLLRRIGRAISTMRVFVANALFLILIVVLLVLAFGGGEEAAVVPDGAALVLELDGPLLETAPKPDPIALLLQDEDAPRPVALRDVREALDRAAGDARIGALVLDLSRFPGGPPASLRALGDAIDAFKDSGKPVVVAADSLAQGQYYLASHADQLYLDPMGQILLTGFAMQPVYFADALDRLRVDVNVFRVGTYKSAVEPFLRNDMSDAAREDARALVQGLWDEWRDVVAGNRGLPPAALDALIDEQPDRLRDMDGDLARLALEAGLVDELLPRDARRARLEDLVGTAEDGLGWRRVGHRAYLKNVRLGDLPATDERSRVAVVVAEGNITGGSDDDEIGESTAMMIRKAREADDVAAIVLRVNSPGGSAFFSEVIRRELELAQVAGKPVVASMGGIAASGGYWISATADRILAEPETITGSIGIFGILPTFQDSADALGVHSDGVGTHALSGANNLLEPLSPALREVLQQSVERGYERFLDTVARGRDMTPEAVDAIAQGRVWTGRSAVELGLVDGLGGLDAATAEAAELAGLDRWRVDWMEPERSARERLLEQLLAGPAGTALRGALGGPSAERMRLALEWAAGPLDLVAALRDPGDLYAWCLACPAGGR
jgi:protease-4